MKNKVGKKFVILTICIALLLLAVLCYLFIPTYAVPQNNAGFGNNGIKVGDEHLRITEDQMREAFNMLSSTKVKGTFFDGNAVNEDDAVSVTFSIFNSSGVSYTGRTFIFVEESNSKAVYVSGAFPQLFYRKVINGDVVYDKFMEMFDLNIK